MNKVLKRYYRMLFSSASVTALSDIYASQKDAKDGMMADLRRNHLIEHILHDGSSGITTKHYVDHNIIVSLTTYGLRLHEVALTIESLMQQTMKANRIVLWLADDLENYRMPQALVMQQNRGLEIKFCRDIRSYKKLIPQIKESPNDAIITVDDDILYDYDVLEHLINSYLQQPDFIHSCRVRKMQLDENDLLKPYNKWELKSFEEGVDRLCFLTSGGGTLFPPNCFDDEVFNEDVFMDICPEADDVWFTAMALKKGTYIKKVFTRNEFGEDYIMLPRPLEQGLSVRNVGLFGNDRQIHAVFSRYSLYEKLRMSE